MYVLLVRTGTCVTYVCIGMWTTTLFDEKREMLVCALQRRTMPNDLLGAAGRLFDHGVARGGSGGGGVVVVASL